MVKINRPRVFSAARVIILYILCILTASIVTAAGADTTMTAGADSTATANADAFSTGSISGRGADSGSELDFGGARNIYIGDIVALEIPDSAVSAGELEEQFKDFEILEIRELSGWPHGFGWLPGRSPGFEWLPERRGYRITLRAIAPGEYAARPGGGNVVISVASVLGDIDRDDVFEGGPDDLPAGAAVPWHILCIASAVVFAGSGGTLLYRLIQKRLAKPPVPLRVFLARTGALAVGGENYLVDLTRCFKDYLEAVFRCRFIGKTTSEIIMELKETFVPEAMLADIRKWLAECDMFKFSGVSVHTADKTAHYEKLLNLTGRIDEAVLAGEAAKSAGNAANGGVGGHALKNAGNGAGKGAA